MLRHLNTLTGGVTVFYPDAIDAHLVLRAQFKPKAAQYHLKHFGTFRTLLNFVIRNDGERIDLTAMSGSDMGKAPGGQHDT